ncbi:hypothetical protein OSB04_023685 [Centaurea solstitialis]|uniref:SWIM-type domain-containing protein n=1 Tax=Centaurea solstitialis TaxID=347529 RepID=A0AA38SS84_9ASTR|nr:hypothetical protein OSB04_023685 [Centaurea solstitialis]
MSISSSEIDLEHDNQLQDDFEDDFISDEDKGIGSKYWIPNVNVEFIPRINSFFKSYQEAISIYERYADQGGFDVRLSTTVYGKNNIVTIKYAVCSREGVAPKTSIDTVHDSIETSRYRRTSLKRTSCKACIRIRFVEPRSAYEIYYFDDKHNHMLIDKNAMIIQLCVTDQIFIHKAASAGVGASKAHKLHTSLNGGYDVTGCTVSDYKNFRRDMNSFVGAGDAEMVISMFKERCMDDPQFSFEFNCEKDQITGIFWADEIAKLNYQEFGDVISFDATFRTNQYRMVFVPFTTIDNHKKCVTVGAGLLSEETFKSFKWLLEAFLKSYGGKHPVLVLTDQCLAMKQAIPKVLTNSRHRLCMFHIMGKVPTKIRNRTNNETEFLKLFNKLVWNINLKIEEFETNWRSLISEFNLEISKWFKEMFRIRHRWIPTYFNTVPFRALMKTTSNSKSINSFFNKYAYHGNNFVTFMFAYENAMRKQRNSQRKLDYVTKTTLPHMCTPKRIEKHAHEVYTRDIFLDVQKQINKAAWSCSNQNVMEKDGCQLYTIIQTHKNGGKKKHFQVIWNKENSTFNCECNHFIQFGILCCHIFRVMMNEDFEEIPERYISRRWRRDIISFNLSQTANRRGDSDGELARLCYDAQSSLDYMLMNLKNDKQKLIEFVKKIQSMKDEIDEVIPYQTRLQKKNEIIRSFVGIDKPVEVTVHPPTGIRNKGCGRGNRLIGAGEKAAKKNERNKRKCRHCEEMVNHDSRNCPLKATE